MSGETRDGAPDGVREDGASDGVSASDPRPVRDMRRARRVQQNLNGSMYPAHADAVLTQAFRTGTAWQDIVGLIARDCGLLFTTDQLRTRAKWIGLNAADRVAPLQRKPKPGGEPWTPEAIARIHTLWVEGHSATYISRALTYQMDGGRPLTRVAVIGVATRQGWVRDVPPVPPRVPAVPRARAPGREWSRRVQSDGPASLLVWTAAMDAALEDYVRVGAPGPVIALLIACEFAAACGQNDVDSRTQVRRLKRGGPGRPRHLPLDAAWSRADKAYGVAGQRFWSRDDITRAEALRHLKVNGFYYRLHPHDLTENPALGFLSDGRASLERTIAEARAHFGVSPAAHKEVAA